MQKDLISLIISGASKVLAEAGNLLDKAISEKSCDAKLAFPDTASYLPLAYALLGIEARTLADGRKILDAAGDLLRQEGGEISLAGALKAGAGAVIAEEVARAVMYIEGREPYDGCSGFVPDNLLRSLGIQLVDGRISGIAVLHGRAKDNRSAVDLIRDLQKRNILTFAGGNVDGTGIIGQLKENGVNIGLDSYIVPYGQDAGSIVYALNFAIRAALTYGGIKAGNGKACVEYVRDRVPAFVLLLGGIDPVKAAFGAGAISAGVPIITDMDLPEIMTPGICSHDECLVKEFDHTKLVDRAVDARGIRIKITSIPVPVPCSAAFEGERVRRENMYVQFGGKYSKAFELLRMRPRDEVVDGMVNVVGPEIDDTAEGSSLPLGMIIDVYGRKMSRDYEPILERQVHKFINYAMGVFHMGQRDMNWLRISKEARQAGFKFRHFGDLLIAKLKDEYGAIVDKAQVTIHTAKGEVDRLLPEARAAYQARDERLRGMTDESVDTFYSCALCQSFAPDHVCFVSPERPGLCGAYSWLDAKAAHEITPTGGNQPVNKGKAIDHEKGIWEGVNNFVYDSSHQKVKRISIYSIMDSPMTSCGCFECVVAIVPEANGVMVVNREYAGQTPAGMTFMELANSVGGGAQTPGFLGVSRLYIASNKFISAEGGLARVVWMPKELKEALSERLNRRCREMGEPGFFDKIADETVTTDAAGLALHMAKVGHPALTLPPLI